MNTSYQPNPRTSFALRLPSRFAGRVLALVAILLHSGCINIPTKVPDEWERAMRRPAPSVAGTYRTFGEMTVKEGGYRIVSGNLTSVFNGVQGDQSFLPSSEAIRLRPVAKDQLELTVLNGSDVVATKLITADLGPETTLDGVKVERAMNPNRKNKSISNLKTHVDAVLIRGPDGFLYVQAKHRATATLGGVVPFGGGGETWLRFPPTPSPGPETQ